MSVSTETRRRPVVERAREAPGYAGVNVGALERAISAAVGVPLVAIGLKRGTFGGLAAALFGGALVYRAVTAYSPLYDALELDSAHEGHAITHLHKGVKVQKTFTVNRSPAECYRFWRDFQNLPRFMTHLKSVSVVDETRSRWEVKAPLGGTIAWEAEIINERPGELIAWKSVGDSDIYTAGSVRFRPAPGGRGTELTVELNYEPPGGRVGRTIAWLLGEEPEHQVREDLRHFKQVMEAGEIPTVEGQPSCRV
jgi:uncharacterized membrane protein